VLIYGAPGCGVSYIANLLTSELGSLGCDAVAAHDLDEVADSDTAELEELLRGGATQDVVIVGATRRPWTMPDAAFGPGGFERAVFVPPPDWDARRFRIWETLTRLGEPASLVEPLVIATEGWSGRDIETELARPLDWSDEAGLISALEHITPASRGWLESARLLTRFGAISRLADDLAAYLQRYRLL
jgi:SpoVK/Ycf46/Vps4 family AAA+-type ATPase